MAFAELSKSRVTIQESVDLLTDSGHHPTPGDPSSFYAVWLKRPSRLLIFHIPPYLFPHVRALHVVLRDFKGSVAAAASSIARSGFNMKVHFCVSLCGETEGPSPASWRILGVFDDLFHGAEARASLTAAIGAKRQEKEKHWNAVERRAGKSLEKTIQLLRNDHATLEERGKTGFLYGDIQNAVRRAPHVELKNYWFAIERRDGDCDYFELKAGVDSGRFEVLDDDRFASSMADHGWSPGEYYCSALPLGGWIVNSDEARRRRLTRPGYYATQPTKGGEMGRDKYESLEIRLQRVEDALARLTQEAKGRTCLPEQQEMTLQESAALGAGGSRSKTSPFRLRIPDRDDLGTAMRILRQNRIDYRTGPYRCVEFWDELGMELLKNSGVVTEGTEFLANAASRREVAKKDLAESGIDLSDEREGDRPASEEPGAFGEAHPRVPTTKGRPKTRGRG